MKKSFFLLAQVTLCALTLTSTAQAADTRFIPNAAGDEVKDTQTNLVWRRCPEGTTWDGTTCSGTAFAVTWRVALTLAKATAASTQVAWRLPNVKELSSLIVRKIGSPLVDTTAFPTASTMNWVWTSTPQYGSAMFGAWVVSPYTGYITMRPDSGESWNQSQVLLVRNAD